MKSHRTSRSLIAALAACVVAVAAPSAHAMSVDEAYARIPHQRTPFSAVTSGATRSQAESLARLFDLSDQAMVLRVRALAALHARDAALLRDILRGYPAAIDGLQQEAASPEVRRAQALVLVAVRQHRAFFEAKLASGLRDAAFTPDVHQASSRLREAYSLLMATFPRETARNRQAFFDHLCALDFL